MEKKVAEDCKHWLFPSCPEVHHPLMMRFRSGMPGPALDRLIDEMDKLCGACPAFTPRKPASHLIFSGGIRR